MLISLPRRARPSVGSAGDNKCTEDEGEPDHLDVDPHLEHLRLTSDRRTMTGAEPRDSTRTGQVPNRHSREGSRRRRSTAPNPPSWPAGFRSPLSRSEPVPVFPMHQPAHLSSEWAEVARPDYEYAPPLPLVQRRPSDQDLKLYIRTAMRRGDVNL